ncbi:hypothetical protein [Streptomyces sp. NPDC046805]|uniref:hypothetical protein n=1 Tax=Streptomyces sp. NPDC046805 TaxID=3155134 RepID=UPI0033ED03D5
MPANPAGTVVMVTNWLSCAAAALVEKTKTFSLRWTHCNNLKRPVRFPHNGPAKDQPQ